MALVALIGMAMVLLDLVVLAYGADSRPGAAEPPERWIGLPHDG